jgi:PKD repeat protein
LSYEFNGAGETIVDLTDIYAELFDSGSTLYYAPGMAKDGLIKPESLTWDFSDGWTCAYNDTAEQLFPFTESKDYSINLTVLYENGRVLTLHKDITVPNRPPKASIEVYQEVVLTLSVAGRKGNTVGVLVYEDGILVNDTYIIRTTGSANSITFIMRKYIDRAYEIELIYDAAHSGSNPAWLEFASGGTKLLYSMKFNTSCGYHQIGTVPSSYLDNVIKNNLVYHFDASKSYDIDGEIVSYHWEFGDGATSNRPVVDYRYNNNGIYIVKLTVTDDDGLVTTVERVIAITTF